MTRRAAKRIPSRTRARRAPAGGQFVIPSPRVASAVSQHFHFWSGKGGVGKTTCAAAAALGAAAAGASVLVVSTDPAHSLADVLGKGPLGPQPVRIALPRAAAAAQGRLFAAEIAAAPGLERWLGEWRPALTAIAERGTVLDRDDLGALFDLTPPGIDELGGLLELMRLARESGCDEVIVDTAPTAHTLRLIAIPDLLAGVAAAFASLRDKHHVLVGRFGGRVELEPEDDAIDALAADAAALHDLLRDPDRCDFVWVTLAESLAVAEAEDGVSALEAAGIAVAELVVNRVLGPGGRGERRCDSCRARRLAELAAIATVRKSSGARPLRLISELPAEPRGAAALLVVAALLGDPRRGVELAPRSFTPKATSARSSRRAPRRPAPELFASRWLEARLLLFGGKGGVGKTTCAAAAALGLATLRPKDRVLLVSTDPAHSLGDVLATRLNDVPRKIPGGPANLWVRELDARLAFETWQGSEGNDAGELLDSLSGEWRVGDSSGRGLAGGVGRELLEWLPAGLDELVGILSLLDALFGSAPPAAPRTSRLVQVTPGRGVPEMFTRVVVDTAPTGHALRLLAMPELALEWDHALMSLLLKYREVVAAGRFGAELLALAARLKRLQGLLRNPAESRFVIVSRPAKVVVAETARLQAAVTAMGIPTRDLVINAVVSGRCATCRPQAAAQESSLRALRLLCGAERGRRRRCDTLLAPALFAPPRGIENLQAWSLGWTAEPFPGV